MKILKPILLILVIFNLAISKDLQKYKNLKYIPGRVLVKFKNSTQSIGINGFNKLQSQYGITKIERTIPTINLKKKKGIEELEKLFTFEVSSTVDVVSLANKIASDENVEFAQPDYLHPLDKTPNDPQYSNLYPLPQVKADTAWGIAMGDSTVSVAIIDTGVDWDHEDLASVVWKNKNEIPDNGIDDDNNGYIDDIRGWDFVSGINNAYTGEDGLLEDNNPMDFDGHGTHVSGITGGATNNGIGIASLGWGIKVMALRCGYHASDGNGYIPSSFASKAYVYAANNGATAANQSSGTSDVVLVGALYAFKNGVVITNSAGNSNSESLGLLGMQPWALSVGALASNDKKASYSSFGVGVDISAPGGDFSGGNNKGFLSSVVNPSSFYGGKLYEYFQGTSMSSPLVASLAGLIKSKFKNMSAGEIMFQIMGTADNINSLNPNYIGKLGAGRINALRAITEIAPSPAPNISIKEFKFDDSGTGNGNGQIEPGEEIKLILTLENSWGNATNLKVLVSTNHWTTTVLTPQANFNSLYGLVKVDSNIKSNTNNPFVLKIDANAIPSVIPITCTITADGGYTKQITISTGLNSQILFVDDDDGVTTESFYFNSLNKIGMVYDYWDHFKLGTPSYEVLKKYNIVIWSCEWAFPSLDSNDRKSLEKYLDNKGKLFISGQDIGWDMCDVDGATIPNEYGNSGGASKIWYEKYLKAKYLNDDSKFDLLSGVNNDPITSGFTIKRFQPGRAASEQYPEVIEPISNSVSILNYTGGSFVNQSGAIRYDGSDYKLIHFGFGGFESIVDSNQRVQIMDKSLGWLLGAKIVVDKLVDTENITNPYLVNAKITTQDSIEKAELYWDTDGTFPFKKISMANNGSGNFSGAIPVQTQSGMMEYFVLVKTSKAYLPFNVFKFRIGPDVIPPTLVVADSMKNSARILGPHKIFATATDNLASGIDSTTFYLKYHINENPEQKVLFSKTTIANNYSAAIIPTTALKQDDKISYFIEVKDNSTNKNLSRYPASGFKYFTLSSEVTDSFEKNNSSVWNYGSWDFVTTYRLSGVQSITDSKTGNYLPNKENILLYNEGINLTKNDKVSLRFYRRANINSSDTCFVEASKDGSTWKTLGKINGLNVGFKKEEFGLDNFTGIGAENVKVRFRLKTDSLYDADGIYIDDFGFAIGSYAVNVANNIKPIQFDLEQNYPNPFNPSTTIKFSVPTKQNVKIEVFDILGKSVANLVDEEILAGEYKLNFNASKLASGIYIYTIKTKTFNQSKKMMFLK